MRFEAECRSVGLLESGDESDEEIKNLQDQIRQKRQQKLASQGQLNTSVQDSVSAQASEVAASKFSGQL